MTAVHAVLLKNGQVLMFGFPAGGVGSSTIPACLWDPATKAVTPVPKFRNNFCSGHVPLADGTVLIVGGHIGDTLKDVVIFDPDTGTARKVATLPAGRWYPSVTLLPDGRALILSGTTSAGWSNDVNNSFQVYDPFDAASPLQPGVDLPRPYSPFFPAGQANIDLYPAVVVLPSGDLLVHSRNTTRFLDPRTSTWSSTMYRNVSGDSRSYPFQGGWAMLPLRPSEGYRVRIVVAGGASGTAAIAPNQKSTHSVLTPATSSCEMLDLGDAAPAWKPIAPLRIGRLMNDLVALPDGTLIAIGGNAAGHADDGQGPVLEPELYDPATGTWRLLASTRVPRGYHATALLLPDGRIMIAGKDGDFQGAGLRYPETRVEVFSPPYLFKGPRPAVAAAPARVAHGRDLEVALGADTAAATVDRAVLVACGSVTHQTDFSQRVVELVLARGIGQLTLTAPPDGNVAPPGHYMLFLIGTNGVPSVASMLQLTSDAPAASEPAPTVSSPLQSQTASLDAIGDAPRCLTPTVAVAAGPAPGAV